MSDLLQKIRLLMVIRVVAVTTLLMSAFLVELWFHPARSLRPLYIVTAGTYVLTIAYSLLYPILKNRRVFIGLQLLGDILTASAFVYITGGAVSPFSFLYVPVIIVAGMLQYRRGAYTATVLSCLAYGLLLILLLTGTLPPYPPESFSSMPAEVKRASFSLLVHFLGFTLVGILSSTLSESLRRTGQELGETREDLEDLQAFNALIIDSVNSGLVTTDQEGRITFINRAAREITGLAEGLALGRHLHQVFNLGEDFPGNLARRLEQRRRYRFEADFPVTRDVVRFLGFTAGILRDKTSRSLGYIFTFQDLTEIKSLEREVLLRERMAAVGEMAAGMAHELRNPLASLSGSAQVLAAAAPGGEQRPGERQNLMQIIRRESQRLDLVLKDFLAFARPRPFAPEDADLVVLLEELVKLLHNAPARLENHEIRTNFQISSLPCRVDVNRLKQVFWNLASNALRAMPDGGSLIVGAGLGQEGTVELWFEDTGRGMSAAEVRDYFRPFRSTFDGGTGLGTAIVYRIAEEHSGRVSVRSQPGQGTRVTVIVPRTPAGEQASEEPRHDTA
ncbi:MAG: ATP-binding protein [Acidobacteria bacterium]|nr:ATP-binding protein [Acidobacteriota bacterium]